MSVSRVRLSRKCSSLASTMELRLQPSGQQFLNLLSQLPSKLTLHMLAETNSNFVVAERVGKSRATVEFHGLRMRTTLLGLLAGRGIIKLPQYEIGFGALLAAGNRPSGGENGRLVCPECCNQNLGPADGNDARI